MYFSIVLFVLGAACAQQQFDTVLYGGRLFDPFNDVQGDLLDIGITNGQIAAVSPFISPVLAARRVNVSGLIVTPGLIDVHSHVFHNDRVRFGDARPDMFCPRSGVTTVVDAGGVGYETYDEFFERVVSRERTRVLTWLSIWSGGNSNTTLIDIAETARAIQTHPDNIIGIKIFANGFFDYTLLDAGLEATSLAGGRPLILDWKYLPPPLQMEDILMNKFRPGDVLTHCYGENPDTAENALVDVETGIVKDYVWAAKLRGVLFDAADGNVNANFAFRQAVPAILQRFVADTISTDLTLGQYFSVDGSVVDLCTIMSKCMAAGMLFEDTLKATTTNAAAMLNRQDLGHLSIGAVADVTVLSISQGNFGFRDGYGDYLPSSQKIEAEITLRAGEVVWDRESRFNRDMLKKKNRFY